MSEQLVMSLREQMFSLLNDEDQDLVTTIDALAEKLANYPDEPTMAYDRAHFLVLLLQKIEVLSIGSDPRLIGYTQTLTRLDEIIHTRIFLPDPHWEAA